MVASSSKGAHGAVSGTQNRPRQLALPGLGTRGLSHQEHTVKANGLGDRIQHDTTGENPLIRQTAKSWLKARTWGQLQQACA